MAREIVKLAIVAAIILIAAVLIGLFASGYITAFKPGGTKDTSGGAGHVVGGGNTISGGVSVVSTPAPSPSPPPMPQMPEAMQQPFQQNPPAQPVQPLQEPFSQAMPSVQPALATPMPPVSWPNQPVIRDRPLMPGIVGPSPVPSPPVGQPAHRESFGVAVAVRAGMDANHPAIRHYTAVPVPGHNPGTDMVAAGLVSLRPHALQPVTGRQITT